jgi:hypothetical protein
MVIQTEVLPTAMKAPVTEDSEKMESTPQVQMKKILAEKTLHRVRIAHLMCHSPENYLSFNGGNTFHYIHVKGGLEENLHARCLSIPFLLSVVRGIILIHEN